MTPLTTRPELDQLRCEEPGCEGDAPILITPTCHDVSTFAEYSKGELAISCAECGVVVLTVPVAG